MNNFFADIVKTRLIPATLTYRGQEKEVWFRPLTASERADLSRGQKMRLGREQNTDVTVEERKTVEVDVHDIIVKTHKMLACCVVDEKGKQVFKNAAEVGALPEDFVNVLNDLANTVLAEDEPGDLGNFSTETQK